MTTALPMSSFPAGSAIAGTDIALFSQGSTGPGTGTTRKLTATQVFGSPIAIGDVAPNAVSSTSGALNGTIGATTKNTGAFSTGLFNAALASGVDLLKTTGNLVAASSAYGLAFRSQIGSVTGAIAGGSNVYNLIQIQADNLGLGSTGTPEAIGLGVYHTFGGTSVTGARTPLRIALTMNGPTNNTIDSFHRGLAVAAYAAYSDGGTAGTFRGKWFGQIIDSALTAGGLYFNQIQGLEIDATIEAGASANYKTGLKIVKKALDATKGVLSNNAFAIVDQPGASVGWDNGVSFGDPNGVWAFRSDSTLIGTSSTILGGSAYVAAYGIDFSAVTFGTAFLKSTGFSVDGSGNATLAKLTTTGGRVRALRVVTAAGAVTVATTDDIVVVNKTVGAATAASLPAAPSAGRQYTIKDGKGDAAANNITITPAAGTIDGAATLVLAQNYAAAVLVYNGTEWGVI